MKILLTSVLDNGNPLIDALFKKLSEYADMQISIDSFWVQDVHESYDIIHIQWPEQLFNWKIITDDDVNRLLIQLKYWKDKNSKIVVTRHNIQPHTLNYIYSEAYLLLYTLADAVIHFSNASVDNFHIMYPDLNIANHVVIPHPMYEGIANTSTRKQARKILNIDQDAKVVLIFGSIRHEYERDFSLKVFKNLKIKNKLLIAPSWFRDRPTGKRLLFQRLIRKAKMLLSSYKKNYRLQPVSISDDQIQYYMNSADVVFLPRFEVLNSGVLVMAYTFNKIVVGPEVGSIGEILSLSNNPAFELGNVDDAAKKLEQILIQGSKKLNNRQYAEDNMSWNLVIAKHIDLYKMILNVGE